ncbi:DUF3466 family protein [Vibrio maritimus]|uniref:DUF3466 family protein n=1 Tax=Vibrio maritimus TaxID=990268 RepID=UPI003736129B
MSRNNFKISLIAASVLAATSGHAALYKVVEVDPTDSITSTGIYVDNVTEFYGSAIQKTSGTVDPLGCFAEGANCAEYQLFGDSRNGSEGHSYRQEIPFNWDMSFFYTDWVRNKDYCRNELGYQTCDPGWTDKMWYSFSEVGGLRRERDAFLNSSQIGANSRPGEDDYFSNALAFSEATPASNPDEKSLANRVQVQPTSDYKPGGVQSPETNSENVVINSLTSKNGYAIGNTSSGYYRINTSGGSTVGNLATAYRHRGYVQTADNETNMLLPVLTEGSNQDQKITNNMGRTMGWSSFFYGDREFIVGSAAVAPFDYNDDNKNWNGDLNNCLIDDPASRSDCQNFAFATQTAVWDSNDWARGASVVSAWQNNVPTNNDKKASQGSARGASIMSSDLAASVSDNPRSTLPFLVGLNTTGDGSNSFLQATVFVPNTTFNVDAIDTTPQWSPITVENARIKSGDDFIYSNTYASDINSNLVFLGASKRRGDKRENGAAANRMFLGKITLNNSTDGSFSISRAQYFDELNNNTGIFFRGVGGEPGAINNFNEIVGAVDAEQSTEYFGKQRRQRGFIYPYNTTGSNPDRINIFQGKPWLLDDLTNGGTYNSQNNQYRIVDAADINDDGVIAATALKCEGGYDTTGHNSYCGNGQKKERVVAVKLIPIANEADRSIQTRGIEAPPVTRSGGSLGWMALILLGFFGLRRNK